MTVDETPKITGPSNPCLGDSWAVICNAARESVLNNKPIKVSRHVIATAIMFSGISPQSGESIQTKLEEILGVLDVADGRVLVVDEAANDFRKIAVDTFPYPYVPTSKKWEGKGSGRVCCQLINHQVPENNDRAIPTRIRMEIETWLENTFDEVVRLWKDRTIAECVEVAATSEAFVGMDSGMSHLCHSVGVPVFLKDWSGLDKHHPGKSFVRFDSAEDLIQKMTELRE
jgi:hypothetical protein